LDAVGEPQNRAVWAISCWGLLLLIFWGLLGKEALITLEGDLYGEHEENMRFSTQTSWAVKNMLTVKTLE
jgi:hypothetical protein